MLNFVLFDNQIKVWWNYTSLTESQNYQVFLNDSLVATVKSTNYSFKNLSPNTQYKVKVILSGEIIGESEVFTKPEKEKIDITKPPYNAVGDGKILNTRNIQKAIDNCKENQCVYFPKGTFLSGALFLHSNMEILLDDNATLQGSTETKDYPKINSRFEGIEEECYASLINTGSLDHTKGYNCKNVVIRGGSIFGGGEVLRKNIIEQERTILQRQLLEQGESLDYVNSNLVKNIFPGRKRGRCMQISNTDNFILADCVCGMSPSWNLHFIYSNNITTCGCQVLSKDISNGDGWDPDSSTNCILFDTIFDTGDDCVAIKSGKNPQGNEINKPTKHVRVFDVKALGGWGIAIGSEMSGGVEDVKVWNADLRKSLSGFTIKAPSERGGFVKDVGFYNAIVPTVNVSQAFVFNPSTKKADKPPVIDNIHLKDLYVGGIDYFDSGKHTQFAINVHGSEDKEIPIKNVKIENIRLNRRNFNPYQEFYFDNVENVEISNIISE